MNLKFPTPYSNYYNVQLIAFLLYLEVEAQTRVDNPHDLEVGSMVEVPMAEGLPRYGVIRWIGPLPQVKDKLVAGLELVRRRFSNVFSHTTGACFNIRSFN